MRPGRFTVKKDELATVRISADEKEELEQLARAANVSLADAFRYGARLFLLAVNAEPTRRGPKSKEQMRDAA
jgi:hypothetical protein